MRRGGRSMCSNKTGFGLFLGNRAIHQRVQRVKAARRQRPPLRQLAPDRLIMRQRIYNVRARRIAHHRPSSNGARRLGCETMQ